MTEVLFHGTKEAQDTVTITKGFIIGKMWLNGESNLVPNITLNADLKIEPNMRLSIGRKSLVVNRDLPEAMTLKAGTVLRFYQNNKRPDKQDADYSVSILLNAEKTDELIATQKATTSQRRTTNVS